MGDDAIEADGRPGEFKRGAAGRRRHRPCGVGRRRSHGFLGPTAPASRRQCNMAPRPPAAHLRHGRVARLRCRARRLRGAAAHRRGAAGGGARTAAATARSTSSVFRRRSRGSHAPARKGARTRTLDRVGLAEAADRRGAVFRRHEAPPRSSARTCPPSRILSPSTSRQSRGSTCRAGCAVGRGRDGPAKDEGVTGFLTTQYLEEADGPRRVRVSRPITAASSPRGGATS